MRKKEEMSKDKTDDSIIEILKKDSRESFVVIGQKLGLSESAVRRRVKNLTDGGIIKKKKKIFFFFKKYKKKHTKIKKKIKKETSFLFFLKITGRLLF